MDIQVLVAAMHQADFCLQERMNIQSEAIIVNQCEKNEFHEFLFCNHKIRFLSLAERGVGLSRNTAMMRSTADIILFADEDMQYVDGYPDLIAKEFEAHPEADVIIFSLKSLNHERPLKDIKKWKRVNRFNALKYGCARIAVRREKLFSHNIWFSLLFGGGAKYSSGEDTIFLQDCIKNKLKVYKSSVNIAFVKQESSTWFRGYNDRYFFDKGVLMATIMPVMCYIYAILTYSKLKLKKSEEIESKRILSSMYEGIKHRKYEFY